jgi:pimeloyl-ACP methyl ester carboxylesterase
MPTAPMVVFSHGRESGPFGRKITALSGIAQGRGHLVVSLDYRGLDDPEARVEKLCGFLEELAGEPAVLVGSSLGGYVAAVAAGLFPAAGLFLMAPALYRAGYRRREYAPLTRRIEVIHGWADDVIPLETSLRFAGLFRATLHVVDSDHRLEGSLSEIGRYFGWFLETIP